MRLRSAIGLAVLLSVAVPFPLRGGATGRQQPVLRAGSQLVQVTVVVRDHRRQPVVGLTADDFDVTENGARVPIAFFHERTAPPAGARSAVGAKAPASPSSRFSNTSPGGVPANVTVILLNRLNTKWSDQAQAREALKVFLAQIRPDDRVAVYALDENALRILHDFTSDASSLLRAVEGAAKRNSRLTDAADADQGLGDVGLEQLESDGAYTTLSALQTIGSHLAGIPGRKNLVWISSGFDFQHAAFYGVLNADAMKLATRTLNTAQLSVYSIDASGLHGAFTGRPDDAQKKAAGMMTDWPNQNVLEQVSEETGGVALLNNNDIAGAIRTAADDAEQHYEIEYYSPAPAADGSYWAIRVTSRRPGVDLLYRRGYFATAVEAQGGDRKSALNRSVGDRLEATGIPLTVTPATVAASPDSLELSVTADGNRLSFTNQQGRWSGGMDLAIAQVRTDGSRSIDVDTTIDLPLTDAQHDAVLRTGLTLKKTIVLGPQTSRLVVVVRDPTSGAVGSVVIPAAKLAPAAR
jgi:VWFA-related protein